MESAWRDQPFDEAISFFRQKQNLPTKAWTDLWEGMHARAFVVAGAANQQLVADFRGAIDKAISEGTTLSDFRKSFDQIVEEHGWSYKGGRDWRTSVIFNTNVRMANAAGKWEQAQRTKATRPYLRYVAVQDDRTRPEHLAWHGTVLPVDDPFWQTHYPPNGWNCRCTVQTLNDRDLDRYGYAVSEPPPVVMEKRAVNTPDGQITIDVPQGIDTGFGYNVGRAAGMGFGPERLAMERHGGFEPLEAPAKSQTRPEPLPVDPPRAQLAPQTKPGDREAMLAAFRKAVGGDDAVFEDPVGQRVQVTQAIVDHLLDDDARISAHRERFFPLIPELIEDPAEIWMGFARSTVTGAVRLRRRYVRTVFDERKRPLALVADQDNGLWSGLTVFQGNETLSGVRTGQRAYRRGDRKSGGAS